MSTQTSTPAAQTEIWFVTTPKGQKQAYRFAALAGRAVRVLMAEAELGLATGAMVVGTKPEWVGR